MQTKIARKMPLVAEYILCYNITVASCSANFPANSRAICYAHLNALYALIAQKSGAVVSAMGKKWHELHYRTVVSPSW